MYIAMETILVQLTEHLSSKQETGVRFSQLADTILHRGGIPLCRESECVRPSRMYRYKADWQSGLMRLIANQVGLVPQRFESSICRFAGYG